MRKISWLSSFITLLYSLLEIVDTRLQKLPLILGLLRLYQYLLIIYYCLRFTFLLPQYNTQQILMPTLQNIDDIIIFKKPFQAILILFFSTILGFFTLLLIARYRLLGNNYTQIISWICTIVTIAARCTWFWIIEQILFVFVSTNGDYLLVGYLRFLMIIPLFVFILYMQLILRNQFVYGVFHSLIPVTVFIADNNIVLFVLLGSTFLYVNLIDRTYTHRILCNSIMIFVVWGVARYFFTYVGVEELILVLISFICGVVHYFYWGVNVQLGQSSSQSIMKMTEFLNKQKDSKIKEEEEIMVFQSHLMLFINSNQFSLEDQELLEMVVKKKDLSTIDKDTHFKLIQIFGKVTKEQNNPFQLFIYDTKLNEGKDYYKSLLTVFDLYHSQTIWNFITKYQLAKLLIKIQNWFIKYKQDNKTDVWHGVNLEVFITKFYNQLEVFLERIYETWTSMNHNIVDFEKIWTNFAQALEVKERIEDNLEVIVNKYKRIEELVKYNSIMCSLSFPKFNRLPLETLTIESQPRASYIKVCQDKITAQSIQFKSLYKYQFQQLHLAPISKLSPLKKSIFHEELALISNLKLIDRKYPILDAYRHLTLANLEVYLEPNIIGKIEYIIFISPVYTKHESYILYNFETDRIEEASKGFCETFEIDVSLFHSFIQKPFLGKQVFEHINLGSPETKKQLLSDTGIPTQINTILLNPNCDISVPQNVYLKIILDCQQQDQKKCIIRIHRQRPNNTQLQNGTNIINKQTNLSIYTKQLQRDKTYNQIIDKKANLKKSSKNTLDVVSIVFTVMIIVCAFVTTIVFYYCSTWYEFLLNYVEGINIRSVSLLDILFQEFNIMHLTNWPPSGFTPEKIDGLIGDLQNQLEQSLYVIQDKTLYSLVTINLPLVSRNIESYGYSLKSTESGLDLFFNIVYSAPLIFTQSIVSIMIQRYYDVIEFATQQNFIEPYLDLLTKFEIVTIVVTAVCLCLLPVVQIFRIVKVRVVEAILSDTQELFSFTEETEVVKKIKMIKRSKMKLRQPLEEEEFKISHTSRSLKTTTTNLLTKKSITAHHLGVKQITKFRPLFQTIFIMITQVLVVSFFFLLLLTNVLTISKQYPTIIDYQKSLSDQQISLKSSFLTIYFDLINLKVNNVTPPNFLHPTSFIDNTVIQSFTLPSYFDDYTTHSWEQTNKDLCKLQFNKSDELRCQNLIGGAMKSGASKTLEIYWDKINQLNFQTLDDIYDNPLFQDLYFMQKYLLAFIQLMRDNFVKLQKDYIEFKKIQFALIMVIGGVIIIISAALGYYHQKQYNEKKSICQSLFNIFPEQNFRREDVREFVTKTNIIDRLSTL